jgi:hypothetical protein
MGGRTWCAPRPGGGCEFGFTLPLVPEESLAALEDEPAQAIAAT